jgi:hypothetical protein
MKAIGLVAAFAFGAVSVPALAQDCVVLLHGLARTENSFLLMQETLAAFDYKVDNSTSPSTVLPVEELRGHMDDAVPASGHAG